MAALSRDHTTYNMFAPPNPPNGMGGPPGGSGSAYHLPPHYHQQPAPRQRTAIACRYCRRRKIRCSGFETSPDGRCANCMRFNQECVFTPVSSQSGPIQAFVPAPPGAVSGRTQIYGPHGTPLPAGYMQGVGADVPHHLPPPLYGNGSEQPPYASQQPDDRSPHLPPPPTGHGSHSLSSFGRRSSGEDYHHYSNQPPSPSSHLHAPGHFPLSSINGSSTYPSSSYGQGPPPPTAGSYYPRPDSPGSHRAEHSSVSPQPSLGSRFHPPMMPPPGRRDVPTSPTGPMPSMQIADLIDGGAAPHDPSQPPHLRQHAARSAADGDMLNRLNYRTGL
jgi:hypothetical protein